ncbi:MAG: hypothetical protein RH917_14860 [Lacipirellulaceae bacterium]
MVEHETATRKAAVTKLLLQVQAVLRLLGVYFFVIGAAGVAEDFASMLRFWMQRDYYDGVMFDFLDLPPRFYGSAVYLLAGLYLIIGGKWLILNVFSSRAAETKVEAGSKTAPPE